MFQLSLLLLLSKNVPKTASRSNKYYRKVFETKQKSSNSTVLKIGLKFLPKTKKTETMIMDINRETVSNNWRKDCKCPGTNCHSLGMWKTDNDGMKLETLFDWAHGIVISSEIGDVEPCIDGYARKQSLKTTRKGTSIQWSFVRLCGSGTVPRPEGASGRVVHVQ